MANEPETVMDPVFCLETLNRFNPTASFTMTVQSDKTIQPTFNVVPGMRDTGCAVSKGYGQYVLFNDVLSLMIKLKDQRNGLADYLAQASGTIP